MKSQKKTKTVEQQLDLYTTHFKDVPKELILSLGYVGLLGDTKLEDVPVNNRNEMFNLCGNLHVVISEALKPEKNRNTGKLLQFLKMALMNTDIYYKNNPPELFHNIYPHKG